MHLLNILFLLVFPPFSLSAQQLSPVTGPQPAVCTMDACLTAEPIVLDGILSESCWNLAVPATDFIQRDPVEGAPASEKTEVRIIYDTINIYIGVSCYDSEPGRIVHNELKFDGTLENDDNFTVVLDTFADRRNGFTFCINPNGARQDAALGSSGLTSNMTVNYNWNGVWDTAASINPDGWSAEIVIPFSTLRFTETEVQEWGINFRRLIVRKNEEVLWSAWGRDDGITQLSRAGSLRNLRNIKRGRLLEVKPYLLGGVEDNAGVADNEFKYGIDAKYPITSNLTLDFTSFTDFAQIEADRTQINLTRFDLKYPEKRDFFLEGADIFEFGSPVATPFYSRRIGLTPDRRPLPILAGARITGKAGKYGIGVMDVQTDDEYGVSSTNYGVVRIKREILDKSSFGMIMTGVQDETGHHDRLLGFDFTFRTDRFLGNKNFFISTDYSENFRDNHSSGRRNGDFTIQYPNDELTVIFWYREVGENYEPEIGFLEGVGIRKTDFHVRFTPRVGNNSFIKQIQMPFRFLFYNDLNGTLISRTLQLPPIGFLTRAEDRFTLSFNQRYESLQKPYKLFKDVFISPADYEWWEGSTTFRSNPARPLSTSLSLQLGDFYNGTKKTFDSSFLIKFSEFLSVESGAIYNRLALGKESFSTQEYDMRLNTNISPRLDIRTYVQWNNDDEVANLNFRIHYIPRVGSDIFFVYNHLWDGKQDYDTLYDATLAKIAYRFEF